MAVGAIVVVGIAVLAAVTLLPALIAALGHRVARPGKIIGRIKPKPKPKEGPGFWERWTAMLMRRPLPFALAATALMLLIASPALVAEGEHRRDRDVPEGLRDPRRLRARGAAARRRGRARARSSWWSTRRATVDGFVALATSSRCPA